MPRASATSAPVSLPSAPLAVGTSPESRVAAAAAVELGRRGAGRVELAAALLTASAVFRTSPPAAATRDPGDMPAADGAGSSDTGALVAEARGILRHCPDPGPVATTWLDDEQRAEAALTRQEAMTEPLTERELTILRLLPAPTPQRELASALFVTPNTLKTHLRAIYRKLGAESRGDAVIRARERGLI